jgi:hypothetical protein
MVTHGRVFVADIGLIADLSEHYAELPDLLVVFENVPNLKSVGATWAISAHGSLGQLVKKSSAVRVAMS